MSTRDELIAGLRELAEWYEQHPEVPLPYGKAFQHCVLADADDAGAAVVEQVAAALDVPVQYDTHLRAARRFSGLTFEVYYVPRERARDWVRRQAVANAATPEQLAAVDGVR